MNPLDSLKQSIPQPARSVYEAVVAAQTRYSLFPASTGDKSSAANVVVGLSGGADSVCLLHILTLLTPHWNLILHAAHADHGLRENSCADADFAAVLADELGVAFHLQHLDADDLTADPLGVEAAARNRRYDFLANVATAVASPPQPATVAVAHHMDDQAETVLMNFVRGSGLRGLSGMPWSRTLTSGAITSGAITSGAITSGAITSGAITSDGMTPDGMTPDGTQTSAIKLVRPLLGVRRAQILAYLSAYGLEHREDITNQDTTRLRNRVRHDTLPRLAELNPQIVETLARTAQLLGPEADRADSCDNQALAAIAVDIHPGRRTVLDLEQFLQLSLAAQRGVLRHVIELHGLDTREIGFDCIDRLLWQVRAEQNASGPHTLTEDMMWTALSQNAYHPALLSIHREGVLPWRPSHPHLSSTYLDGAIPYALDHLADHLISSDWSLRCWQCGRDDLPVDWQDGMYPWRAFLDADQVRSPQLTIPAAGMSFSPLGMHGQHKKLGDFFTDRKTSPALREQWPIVVDAANDTVVWVCGHAISHIARVTSATRRILCLEWHKTGQSSHRVETRRSWGTNIRS